MTYSARVIDIPYSPLKLGVWRYKGSIELGAGVTPLFSEIGTIPILAQSTRGVFSLASISC